MDHCLSILIIHSSCCMTVPSSLRWDLTLRSDVLLCWRRYALLRRENLPRRWADFVDGDFVTKDGGVHRETWELAGVNQEKMLI